MSLRDAARQAWLSDQQSSESDARTALVGVLGDQALVDGLDALHVDVGDGYVRWFFQDVEGVTLRVSRRAATETWTVNLVAEDPEGWVDRGAVTSLKKLWEILPASDDVQQWVAGEDVVPGDRRSYDGVVYECIQGHTTQSDWTPPETPSLWEVV